MSKVIALVPFGLLIIIRASGYLSLALLFYPVTAESKSPDEIYREVSKSVVIVGGIITPGGQMSQGSGVVVSKDSIVTNCHVVANVPNINIVQNNLSFRAHLSRRHASADLCLLSVSNLPLPAISNFVPLNAIRVGQRAYTVGSPFGLELSLSEGLISGMRNNGTVNLIQTSAIFSNGSSGGGLFDIDGAIIGITTLKMKDEAGIGFALPFDLVRELLLDKNAIDVHKEGGQRTDASAMHEDVKGVPYLPAPTTGFSDPIESKNWLAEMSRRLRRRIPDQKYREEFLTTLHYESIRAGLDPQLVLSIIDVVSGFRQFAESKSGAQGYMQVMPQWIDLIGNKGDRLFNMRTNLRYGCVIFGNYIAIEDGNVARALARYNGSPGTTEFARKVVNTWRKTWKYDGKLAAVEGNPIV